MTNSSLKRLFNKHNKSSQLTLTLASLGLLLLLIGTFTLPFNQGLFSQLFIKPASHAATTSTGQPIMDMAFPCGFTNPAFCDNFSEGPAEAPYRGRGNDLDLRRWSFNRINPGGANLGQGILMDWWNIEQVEHCKTIVKNVAADQDSFFCGSEISVPSLKCI